MELSIIVPVYNVKTCLCRCLDSILSQTFHEFELILVDDGSTDGSADICDKYAAMDGRIKVIHQKNGGAAAARNAGLDVATGKYIAFVDSDDCVSPDMYRKMLERAEATGAEVVSCGLTFHIEGEVSRIWPHITSEILYQKDQLLQNFFPQIVHDLFGGLVNKVYVADIFSDLRIPPSKVYEDGAIQLAIIDRCRTFLQLPDPFYQCYRREGSLTNSCYGIQYWRRIDLALSRIDFFTEKNIPTQYAYAVADYADCYLRHHFAVYLKYKDLIRSFSPYKKAFRKATPSILKNQFVCKTKRIAIISLYVNKRLAFNICRRYFPECLLEEFRALPHSQTEP